MKGIEEEIQKRTQSTIEKILARAGKIKERELHLAGRKREETVSEGIKKADADILVRKNSLKAQMELEYRLREETFKDELISKFLDEVREELLNLDDAALLAAHKNLIREGVIILDSEKVGVRVNRKVAELLKEHYRQVLDFIKEKKSGFTLMEIDDSLDSYGVIVEVWEGREFFNNTFERRFVRFEDEFKEMILAKLEGYGG